MAGMLRGRQWWLGLGILLVVALLLLAGCQTVAERSERVDSGWSRGEQLGQASLNTHVGLAVSADGSEVALVWGKADQTRQRDVLHLVKLDRAGRVLLDRDLVIGTTSPSRIELFMAQGGDLHLLWVDSAPDGDGLFYAPLDAAGIPTDTVRRISSPVMPLSGYAAVLSAQDALDVFWSTREGEGAGLYYTRIGSTAETSNASVPLGRKGFEPSLHIDAQGSVRLAWYEEPGFNEYHLCYAVFDRQRNSLGVVTDLASFPLSLGLSAHRPGLGLTTTDAYIFWSIERRGGGLTAPMAETYWLTFPLGQPDQASRPRAVTIPSDNYPSYARTAGSSRISRWAAVPNGALSSAFVYMPSPNRDQRPEVITAFAVELEGRTSSTLQIALARWAAGKMNGYQIAAKTRNTSLRPVLIIDGRDDLHLAWIDTAGFGRFDVYYASSAPEAQANLNRLRLGDITATALNILWGVAQAMGFLPIVFVWSFLPLVVVVIYAVLRAEDDMARRGPRVMLIVAAVLYIAFKYLFRPGWLGALPLPRNTPGSLAETAIMVAPLLISALAGLVIWVYVRKREGASLFPTLGIFVGVDTLLTLLIYVPGLLAE